MPLALRSYRARLAFCAQTCNNCNTAAARTAVRRPLNLSRPQHIYTMEDSVTIEEATVTVQPDFSQRPDAKTRRYDRQLRLWAAAGQSALEQARVLVINGTASATATLKNLVLPGIGHFTVLDPATVTGADIGNNFFLEPSSLGKPRAEEVVRLLKEMNDGVEGTAVVKDASELLASDPFFFTTFTLIIASDVTPDQARAISDHAWQAHISLLLIRTAGFLGYLRLQVNEHTVVDTHPDAIVDLRLDQPFPALLAHAQSFDLESMTSADHSHVPYVVLLIKYLEEWKATHGGNPPGTYAEKKEFKELLKKGKRQSDEENFDEAEAQAWRAFQPTNIPSEIEKLFADPACENISAKSSPFWLLVRALRTFARTTSHLPLPGVLPDMRADTARYVALQTIYKTQARADLAAVRRALDEVLDEVGLPRETVGEAELVVFVKNAAFLKVFRGRKLKDELQTARKVDLIKSGIADEPSPSPLAHYVALLAADNFYAEHKRWPGADKSVDFDAETAALERAAGAVVAELGIEGGVPDEAKPALGELARAGASDLPNTAAFMGGLVAQEAIKLLTAQYIPINNTCIVDLIKSTTAVFEL